MVGISGGAVDKAEMVRRWDVVRRRSLNESCALFTACMKDERSRNPVILAPHQALGLEFMDYHKRGIMIWPVNHSKTTDGIAWVLRKILKNPSSRGAIVSATQLQASKILSVIKGYIEEDEEFMSLALDEKTGEVRVRKGEKWTDTLLIVARPPGQKDPTVVAVGADSGGLTGARLDWILVDDLLNFENTRTKEQRDKVFSWFDSTALSRLEADGQIMVMNSAWHPDDVLHRLEALGWATLRMQVTGDIYLKDDVLTLAAGKMWDSDLVEEVRGGDPSLGVRLRLKPRVVKQYRAFMKFRFGLVASNDNMLWDPHPSIQSIDQLKRKHPITSEYNRLYMSHTRDDGSAMCKIEWIELCKRNARERGYFRMPKRVSDPNRVFTGVDLAFSKADGSDDTAIFTFEALPDNRRLIIDIVVGKLSGPEIQREVARQHRAYGGVFRVENNGAQTLLEQFMREENIDVPVRGHTTGQNKARADFGVPSIFSEFANGAWLIPNAKDGSCEPAVQRLINGCLYYTPAKHTDDILMAMWFAREQAREFGVLSGGETALLSQGAANTQAIGAMVMTR